MSGYLTGLWYLHKITIIVDIVVERIKLLIIEKYEEDSNDKINLKTGEETN
ncbi:MAG: hypothetical protein K0S25_2243 [Bacillus sp. (in: firmicutes)]|jgi:hypothetical protein|nr:hypothetical protein [Bacillus sp. (in: firmicutes)]